MHSVDRKLPGLAQALNHEYVLGLFARSFASSANEERGQNSLIEVRPRLLKHVPGKRCVIAYHLHFSENPSVPRQVIGKLYRKERGHVVFENLQSVQQAIRLAPSSRFAMPEPLAYFPEIGMVLQEHAPGRPLAVLGEGDDLPAAIRYTAENLAALHALSIAAGEQRALVDHIDKYCHPGPQTLMDAQPELAPLVQGLLAKITGDENLSNAPRRPVHGDVNLAQIFITAERAYFIDFDGFCQTHAALDVGNFLVTLQVHYAARSHQLIQNFLERYLAGAPADWLRGLQTYQALAYLRRAMICFRLQTHADWPQEARALLKAGHAVLGERQR